MQRDILNTVESLPDSVGVYIMKDSGGKAVYIGKANNIRSRVRSYFTRGKGDNRLQIPHLVDVVVEIDYMVTDNEREALILENSLIKKHKPRFNIQLKDDKTYASLRLSVKDKFPKLTFSRKIRDDGAVYFGPFASGGALKQVKKLVHKLFPIRDCSDEKFKRHWQRPCLNYNMKLCLGPCAGKVGEEEYIQVAEQARHFLSGNKNELLNMLKKNMYKASEETRYEDAAYYRNQIEYLKKNMEVERFMSTSLEDRDIVGIYRDKNNYEFLLLHSRDGQIVDKTEYRINNYNENETDVLEEFIARLYLQGRRYIPREILLPVKTENMDTYAQLLSEKKGRKVAIKVPGRGAKRKLIQLARKNARESFSRNSFKQKQQYELLSELRHYLGLEKLPETIECFDISNIQGNFAVASMVRFRIGQPDKDRYRRYKIKTVSGPDDYASMHEVISRRLKRAGEDGWELPDLILIDGGKGQLNAACNAALTSDIKQKVEFASIAKSRRFDEPDRIYVSGNKDPLVIRENTGPLYLLMRIRDEAHRFAIEYHKKLRNKKAFASELNNIPGVGDKRRISLLNHFGSVEAIKDADTYDLASLPGMNRKVAEQIKKYLG